MLGVSRAQTKTVTSFGHLQSSHASAWSFVMMQGAYVLCRLFRKSEEKSEILKYNDAEAEPTTSSPIAKSSPDDTSSDLVQETAAVDMQMNRQSEGINGWLTDRPDNVASNAHIPVESCSNSYLTSDVDDYAMEGPPFEAGFYLFVFFIIKFTRIHRTNLDLLFHYN